MNNYSQASNMYGDASVSTATPRQIEYQVFVKVTQEMRKSSETASSDFSRHAEALHDNLKLWTILIGAVIENGNGLPDVLRARLFHLGEFTRNHTRKVLRGEGDVEALVDINTAIMRGLRQQQSASQAQKGAA